MADDKKENVSWIHVPTPKETYKAFSYLATEHGMNIPDMTVKALEKFIMTEGPNSKNSRVRIKAADLEREAGETAYHQLRRLYAAAGKDEEKLEQVKALADDAGVPLETLSGDVDKNPYVMEILQKEGVTKAEVWLCENLEPDKWIAVNSNGEQGTVGLKQLAEKAGFKWHTIQHARDHINDRTDIYIRSKKFGKPFFWKLEHKQEEQEESL